MSGNRRQDELAACLPNTPKWKKWKREWRDHVLRYIKEDGEPNILAVLALPGKLNEKKLVERCRQTGVDSNRVYYDTPKRRRCMYMDDLDTTPIITRVIDTKDHLETDAAVAEVSNNHINMDGHAECILVMKTGYYFDLGIAHAGAHVLMDTVKRPHPSTWLTDNAKRRRVDPNAVVVTTPGNYSSGTTTAVVWFKPGTEVYTRGEMLARSELGLLRTSLAGDRDALQTVIGYL